MDGRAAAPRADGGGTGRRSAVAVSAGDDPVARARELRRLHSSWSATDTVPDQVRDVIARAWRRQAEAPAPRTAPAPRDPVGGEEVARRRAENAVLAAAVPTLERTLLDVAVEASNELVVCDADGVVLWLSGPGRVRRSSERLGFVEGACWTEEAVGTNALGTALADDAVVQIFGPEHSREDQHPWVCTGSPIHSSRTGRVVGAVTLSGPLRSAHPHTFALVASAVRMAETLLEQEHREELSALAARATAGLRDSGGHIVVDDAGWVAATEGITVTGRLWVPSGLQEGTVWVPSLGHFDAAPTAGGWVLRPLTGSRPRLELHPAPPARLLVTGPDGPEEVPLTARHTGIVEVLARHPDGLSGRELASLVYGRAGSTVAVRAEVSRLRRTLGGLLGTRPYRLTAPCTVVP